MKKLSILSFFLLVGLALGFQFFGLTLYRDQYIYKLAKAEHKWLISLYHKAGIDLDRFERHGKIQTNALLRALQEHDLSTVRTLLSAGCDGTIVNPQTNVSALGFIVADILIGNIKFEEAISLPQIGEQIKQEHEQVTATDGLVKVDHLTLPPVIINPALQQNCSDGFNAAVIPYKDQYLAAYRFNCYLTGYVVRSDYLGISLLDANFHPSAGLSILSDQLRGMDKKNRPWDPRLFVYKDQLYMLFDMDTNLRENADHALHKQSRTMYLAELNLTSEGKFIIKRYMRLFSPYHENAIEKNWSPLIHDGKLYLVYSLYPDLIVLEPNLDTGECVEISKTKNELYKPGYGNLRGGTPFINTGVKNQYFALPHITMNMSLIPNHRAYFITPILIEYQDGKFIVKAMSTTPMFSSVIPQQHDAHTAVIFSTTIFEEKGEYKVTIGVNDQDTYLLSLNKQKLLDILASSK